MHSLPLLLLIFLALSSSGVKAYLYLVEGNPLVCNVGYGQRGKLRSAGVKWIRTCHFSNFCWEATTTDVSSMKLLFDFPFDDYYDEYYLQGCGGDYGTERFNSPFKFLPSGEEREVTLDVVPINVTVPSTITGRGGTIAMDMQYACLGNFCSGAPATVLHLAVSFSLALTVALLLL